DERRRIFKDHRLWLLLMGVATGYLGAAPSALWATGWFFAPAFPLLVPVIIWLYTLIFAFSSLWFAHFCLAALAKLRGANPDGGEAPPKELLREPVAVEKLPAPEDSPGSTGPTGSM